MLSDYSGSFDYYTVTVEQDETYGALTYTPVFVDTYWGYIEYKSLSQPIIEGGKNLVIAARIHLNNILDIDVTGQVNYLGWMFSIEGVSWGDDETILDVRKIQQ